MCMKTIRVYRLNTLSPTLFRRLKAAQQEAARVWNLCIETHKQARMSHAKWPGRHELEQATKGCFTLNAQAVQQIVHAFLANVETTRTLRKEHPEMRMKYPWHTKRFYPVKWPAQAVHREKWRVILPMGRGNPSLVLPIALPEHTGACTLVWNRGFELHVCATSNSAGLPRSRAAAKSTPVAGKSCSGRRTRCAGEPSGACATSGIRPPAR
jgi:putative transposase